VGVELAEEEPDVKERTIYVVKIAHYDQTHLISAFPTKKMAEDGVLKIEADQDRVRGPIEVEEVTLYKPDAPTLEDAIAAVRTIVLEYVSDPDDCDEICDRWPWIEPE
jgi:hypothetical protein